MQKLQSLSSDNSKGELSIERYLVKSEEAYFDKVRKDKLSSAASYISSHRDSVWSSTSMADGDRSRPASACFLFLFYRSAGLMLHTAPGTPSTHPFTDGSGMLPYGGDVVIMTRVQIAMARKIYGWPLYTIVIAIGQASVPPSSLGTRVLTCIADVGCEQLPNDAPHGAKLSG